MRLMTVHGVGGAVRAEKGKDSTDPLKVPDAADTMPSHEARWAVEGDVAAKSWEHDQWSAFASFHRPLVRSLARQSVHGFDLEVVSEGGTKRMVER